MVAALPWIGVALSAVGTGVSYFGQKKAGEQQEAAYAENARIAGEKAAAQEEISRYKLRKLLARQRALYAKAGVDPTSGSPLLVLTEQIEQGEKEAQTIRRGALDESQLYELYGSQARSAGNIGARTTFLTGMGQTAIDFYKAYKGTT